MILSIQQLTLAVATALEDEVLPAFEARSWQASRVRSSLGLLQLVIDQARREMPVLLTANGLIRAFLTALANGQLGHTAEGLGLQLLLPEIAEPSDIAALRAESEALRTQLSQVIRSPHRIPGKDDVRFRDALHALLRQIEQLEKPIYDEAIRFLPM